MSFFELDEIIDSPKDIEMKWKGFKFITNFNKDREVIYKEAANITNLKIIIETECYDANARLIEEPNLRALYVESNRSNLVNFWRNVEEIEQR